MKKRIGIIGGGAAGFFTAANLDPVLHEVTIFEKSKDVLQKVKVSGGGRCNVTNACFNPRDLVKFYPRGTKELNGIFHQFQPGDTMGWFQKRGVELKIEDDNRIFPLSNQSQSIVDALYQAAVANNTKILTQEGVNAIGRTSDGGFLLKTKKGEYTVDILVLTTGGTKSMFPLLENLGCKVIPSVPSLFTFKCKDPRIEGLMGLSFPQSEIKIKALKREESGSLLITHWGFSGPGILKLSAWEAIRLADLNYEFDLTVNWIGQNTQSILEELKFKKGNDAKQQIQSKALFGLAKRFWLSLVVYCQIDPSETYAQITHKQLTVLAHELTQGKFEIQGKSTFKDEFVNCGGIDLKEVNTKTMESKMVPNLYFAGEVLNIDAITGGFNFQAAWSTAFIVSKSLNNP